jgi:nucleoid-associated protein YgaU
MKRLFAWVTMGLVGISFAGCSRIQTKIVEKPRVDQEIEGNRGYLKGSAPAGGLRRATREMVETNVELPTWAEMNPWRKPGKEAPAEMTSAPPAPMPDYEPPLSRSWEPETPSTVSGPVAGTTYTVQKGDTLQKISQKFYGTTKNWYKIYKANTDVLKGPDKIRPGQTITIPGAEGSSPEELSNEYK